MDREEYTNSANISGEDNRETSAKHSESCGEGLDETGEGSGWTTTKAAAKVLGVTRRSVQSYIHRGMLEAREEGEGVEKTFYVSIDSLTALLDRRRRETNKNVPTANFADLSQVPSPKLENAANVDEVAVETLRRVIERLEIRTAEAAGLQARLELTERAESTVRAERDRLLADLEDEREERRQAEEERRRDRDEATRLREELADERSKGFFRRLFGG